MTSTCLPAARPWPNTLLALLLMVPSGALSNRALAQPQALPFSQTKAANLARMRAESLHGGVSNYRPDRCMYTTGAPDCLVDSTDKGYVFRFRGGPPGWQQRNPPDPTVITTVTVSADGETIRDVRNRTLP